MTGTAPQTYSLPEAAELLGMHENTVRNMWKRGEIRTIRIGKFRRVPAEEVTRALTEGTRPAEGKYTPGKRPKPAA